MKSSVFTITLVNLVNLRGKSYRMDSCIKISEFLPVVISTRSSVKRIEHFVSAYRDRTLIFDFSEIRFISRSASDELMKLILRNSVQAEFINTNGNIKSMLDIVRFDKKRTSQKFAITKIDSTEDLIAFFETV